MAEIAHKLDRSQQETALEAYLAGFQIPSSTQPTLTAAAESAPSTETMLA